MHATVNIESSISSSIGSSNNSLQKEPRLGLRKEDGNFRFKKIQVSVLSGLLDDCIPSDKPDKFR